MTPQQMFPFFVAYGICASSTIFLSLITIAIFLGLVLIDLWNMNNSSKVIKIVLSVCVALFPEIGVLSWALYFGRNRKLIFRTIAFLSSGVYLILQISVGFFPGQERGLCQGIGSALIMHFMWLPFILVGGVVSFFILRAILSYQKRLSTDSINFPDE